MKISEKDAKQSFRYFKNGVIPPNNIEFFTVGRGKERKLITKNLRAVKAGNSRHLFLEGNYGSGKSHMLKLIQSIAQRNGFATAWITLDGYQHAFNHPTRYLHRLLGNICVGKLELYGLANICTYWMNNGYRKELVTWASKRGVPERFKNALNIFDNLDKFGQPYIVPKYFIEAEDLRFKNGRNYFWDFYSIILWVTDLCRSMGLNGIVFLFDEFESIVTLLRNVRSQLLSYIILNKLTDMRRFARAFFVFSATPDFNLYLKSNRWYYRYYTDEYSDGVRFIDKWINGQYTLLKLNKLSNNNRKTLCLKLLKAHSIAYSWSPSKRINSQDIISLCDISEKLFLNEREFLKLFTNILELTQQHLKFKPKEFIASLIN